MRNYRILRISPISYKPIQEMILEKHPDYCNQTYYRQQEIYFKYKCVYSNGFSKAMNKIGNEAFEIIYDFEIMQKNWAKEKQVIFDEDSWMIDILFKQIKFYKPDVIYIQGTHIFSDRIKEIKEKCLSVKLIVSYSGYPQDESNDLDLLIVGYPMMVDIYKKKGFNVHHIYHSFDSSAWEIIKNNEVNYNSDISFIGSSGYSYAAGHHSRYWGLIELIRRTNIKLRISEPLNVKKRYENAKGNFPKDFKYMKPLKELYPERCLEPLYGIDMLQEIRNTKVLFNLHPEFAAYESAGSIRMFEATGVGACLLTDRALNMSDLFEEDKEIIMYSSIEECVEKINYLLEHEKERKKIAKAGQKRTLKDHTHLKRCEEIDSVLKKML